MSAAPDPAAKHTEDDRRRGWTLWLLLFLLLLLAAAILWGVVGRAWALRLEEQYRGSLRSQLVADYSADPREMRFAPLEPEIVEEVVRERRTPEVSPSPTAAAPTPPPESATALPATRPGGATATTMPSQVAQPTVTPGSTEPALPPPTAQSTARPSPTPGPPVTAVTPSATPTRAQTRTPTPPHTRTPTPGSTRTPLRTATPSPSTTPTPQPTPTPTETRRPTTPAPSATPTAPSAPTSAPTRPPPTAVVTPIAPATPTASPTLTPLPSPTPLPVLAAEKAATNTLIRPGDTTTFHIDVTNQGVSPANNVAVADIFPLPLAILSIDPPPFQHSGQAVVWRFPEIAPGASVRLTVRTDLPDNVVPPGASETLVNTAQVSADGIPAFETAPVYIDVHYPPRLHDVPSSITPRTVIPGQVVSFRIAIRNEGGAGVTVYGGTSTLTFGLPSLPACRAHLASDTYIPGNDQAVLGFDSCEVPRSFVPGETYPVHLHLVGEDDNLEPYSASWSADPSNYPQVISGLSRMTAPAPARPGVHCALD